MTSLVESGIPSHPGGQDGIYHGTASLGLPDLHSTPVLPQGWLASWQNTELLPGWSVLRCPAGTGIPGQKYI